MTVLTLQARNTKEAERARRLLKGMNDRLSIRTLEAYAQELEQGAECERHAEPETAV